MFSAEFHCGPKQSVSSADADSSLLAQALAQGFDANYACKRGDCGQCAAELLAGELKVLEPAWPSRLGSKVLLCNVAAGSDIVIRLPFAPELQGIRSIRSPAKVQAINRLSADVIELVLRLPPSNAFKFLPGQYVRLTNRHQLARSYSLAQGMADDKLLRLHIRRVEGGRFSEWLFGEAAANDLLQMEGPLGHFFIREAGRFDKTLFVATGTGIAPVYAMLTSLTAEQRQRCGQIHVYWGNRLPKDAYLQQALAELAGREGFALHLAFSRSEGAVAGKNRHVQDLLVHDHESLAGSQIFAAGAPPMVDELRTFAAGTGLDEENFHADPFTMS